MMLAEGHRVSCTLGRKPLFLNLDFRVGKGQVIWLKGANGSGKSTFLRALAGTQAVKGELKLFSRPLTAMPRFERECIVPMVDQSPVLDHELLAIDNFIDHFELNGSVLTWLSTSRQRIRRRAAAQYRDVFSKLGLTDQLFRPTRELSVGQRRMLSLVRAMRLSDTYPIKLVLLDEPLSGLRDNRIQQVLELIRSRQRHGWSFIVAEHVQEFSQLESKSMSFPSKDLTVDFTD